VPPQGIYTLLAALARVARPTVPLAHGARRNRAAERPTGPVTGTRPKRFRRLVSSWRSVVRSRVEGSDMDDRPEIAPDTAATAPATAPLVSPGAVASPAAEPPAPAASFSLSVAAAWRAYRADPMWVRKTLLGGLAYMIPVVGPLAVMSWQVGYIRRVAWGDDRPLPGVGDLETLAKRALYLFAGTFVWALPSTRCCSRAWP
jgi:hypothetical protein